MKILMEDKEHLWRIECWRGWRVLGRMGSLVEDEEDGELWERLRSLWRIKSIGENKEPWRRYRVLERMKSLGEDGEP